MICRLTSNDAAVERLEEAIATGRQWYIALLEAVGFWDCTNEVHNDRTYCYLIDGEALDWMMVAERLCEAVDNILPEDEKIALLFHGKPPVDITVAEFRQLIGSTRYHQYLNYFYGVTVEEALLWAVKEEVRKERWVSGITREHDPSGAAYQRIYRQDQSVLLKEFRKEKGYRQFKSTTLLEVKEFTYWLFKYRLKHSDKARIASDTRKGLDWLSAHGLTGPLKV